jgi:hypothetical protein
MTEENKDESASQTDDITEVAKLLDIPEMSAPSDIEEPQSIEDPQPEAALTTENEEQINTTEEKSEKQDISPEVQKSIDKRIAKEVSKRKALEEQLAEQQQKVQMLEGKITETPQTQSVPTELTQMSVDQLQEEDRKGREYMVWASEGPLQNGYETTDEKGETKYYSPEDIQETYNYYNKRVLLDIPQAHQHKQGVAQKLNAVALANPVLQDESSTEFKTFKKVWQSKEYQSLQSLDNGPQMAWLLTKGILDQTVAEVGKPVKNLTPPNFTPTAPKVPVAPAPSRAKSISKQSNGSIGGLTEEDFAKAKSGDLESVVAKLI